MAKIAAQKVNLASDQPTTYAERAVPVPVSREKRTTQFARGVKQGLIKSTVDNVVEQISNPLVERIVPRLHELHPGLTMADPAVKSVLEFAVITALAEIIEWGGPTLAKMPGVKMTTEEAKAKMSALAGWMRVYAAEKIGGDITEAAAALVPIVAGMLSEVDISDLMGAFSQEVETNTVVEATTEAPALFKNAGLRQE